MVQDTLTWSALLGCQTQPGKKTPITHRNSTTGMRGAEVAGGTFAGGERLAVLDVELAEVNEDPAFPVPNRHLLVLRYLNERHQNDPMG